MAINHDGMGKLHNSSVKFTSTLLHNIGTRTCYSLTIFIGRDTVGRAVWPLLHCKGGNYPHVSVVRMEVGDHKTCGG